MFQKRAAWFLLALCMMLLAAPFTLAQDTTEATGNVQVVQIFYQDADLYIDDQLAFPNVAFTVATDFIPLPVGSHRVTITSAGGDVGTAISTTVNVAEGHDYSVITMGEFETNVPTLLTIDQTSDFADYDLTGNNAIIVQNLAGAIPVDVWFLDQLKIENLIFGGYGTANAPLGEFEARAVMAGHPDTTLFESQYFAVPGTVSLAYLSGNYPDQINRNFFTTSKDNMADYLAKHNALDNSKLSTFYSLLEATSLIDMFSGESLYTLFAPTNAAFAALPDGTMDALSADPEALANLLRGHMVEGRLGPYELTGEHSLTSLGGTILDIEFQPIEVPLSVNGVPTGLQHRVSNGIIYLIDSVLLPTTE